MESLDDFKTRLADHLGVAEDDVYASQPKDGSALLNQLWQGTPIRRRFALGVGVVSGSEGDHSSALAAAKHRLRNPANGFGAILLVERAGDGRWTISDVVEYHGSALGKKLHALLGKDFNHSYFADPQTTAKPPPPDPGDHTMEVVDDVVSQLRECPNVILQGPPGTGKTFVAELVLEQLAGGPIAGCRLGSILEQAGGNWGALLASPELEAAPLVWEMVQLHPAYSYDDLVRGRAADPDSPTLRFMTADRIVVQMAIVAAKRGTKPTVLVLDEINRCNLPAVLGELVLGLEASQRGRAVRLQYPAEEGNALQAGDCLVLPPNLFFIGTMNTADRSIALIDFAIRRRFRFIDVMPDVGVLDEYYATNPGRGEKAKAAMAALGALVADRNLAVGHSYFLIDPTLSDWGRRLANRIAHEVAPLLREYAEEGRLAKETLHVTIGGKEFDLRETADLSSSSLRDSLAAVLET